MGTIAARDALRILELTEQVAAALILACSQGVQIRKQLNAGYYNKMTAEIRAFHEIVAFKYLDEDRPLDEELRTVVEDIRDKRWELYR